MTTPDSLLSIPHRLQMIGAITHLMINSPLHRQYKVADIVERFVPALIHNQFRYYEINGDPIGFVNWAWLSNEVEEKFKTGQYVLNLDEWAGGENLWFPEFIAPFGHARLIIKDLRTNFFKKGTPAKSLKVSPDGSLKAVYRWRA
jgi:cytolysin-activating lysine-acyltransferase